MLKNNFIHTKTKSFCLFYALPFLLSLILFIAYHTYNGPVNLCQDNVYVYTLFDLKLKLTIETANYRLHTIMYEQFSDLQSQILRLPLDKRDDNFVEYVINNRESSRLKMLDSFTLARNLEIRILRHDPDFVSAMVEHHYPRIGTTQQNN